MGEITEALRRAMEGAGRGPASRERDTAPRTSPPAPEPVQRHQIPTDRTAHWKARAVWVQPHGAIAEHFRQFALKVERAARRRDVRSVAVTSAMPREGKTTVASNLALALASLAPNRRFALVDLDLRRPTIAAAYGLEPEYGVEACLEGAVSLDRVRFTSNCEGLDLYPAAKAREDTHGLLGGSRAARLIRELRDAYDLVVFDTPPALAVTDAAVLIAGLDGWVAVAKAGTTRSRAFGDMIGELPQDKLLGVFLNGSRRRARRGGVRYYGAEDRREGS